MRKHGRLLAALVVVLGNIASASAQSYPSRPITVVVPFPAGGGSDLIARIVVERMRTSLGQPLIVENAAGASGSIGVGRVARAAPDGYTLVIGQWSHHVLNGATYHLQYDFGPTSRRSPCSPPARCCSSAKRSCRRRTSGADRLAEANPDKATARHGGVG